MNNTLDDTWQRFPEARIRMRENGLKSILEGLGEDGFCVASAPRIQFIDEGIYVDFLLNVGKHGNVVALPLEILIPAKMPISAKKKTKGKTIDETDNDESGDDSSDVVADELHDDEASSTE